MVRITSDAEGNVLIGLLEIEKGRQAEKEGVSCLLKEMLGYEPLIQHNTDGKPFLKDYNISISHTIGYVVVILSREYQVGIDIEYVSERVNRITSRFLRDDELFHNTRDLLLIWCAKETAYKLFSSEHLAFKEIKVNPYTRLVSNLRRNITIKFKCECTTGYVLTYCWY
nr:4'-phosphopantetheinyl transferase superfamily protein [uncultured Prevotella sp.]